MKYTVEVKISLPRNRVIELFDSQENLFKWQKGLKSFDIVSGIQGEDGLKSKLIYEGKGKPVIMHETIEKYSFPDQLIAIYEADNVWNRCDNTFHDKGNDTIWRMETEFRMKGVMRLIGFLGKKMFVSQTKSDMEQFRDFAETQL